MEPAFLDRFSRLDSLLHRLPAWLKLAASIFAIVAALLLPAGAWKPLGFAAVVLIALSHVSRIPWSFLIRRVLLLELFVIGVALMSLFSAGGWRLCLFLLAKCGLCLWVMVLLSNTTRFAEILKVLQAAGVPALLITTLSLMYRYLFVLMDEAQRMRRARICRSFAPRTARIWRARASVVGQLFVRSSERAERIYGAMCARGGR